MLKGTFFTPGKSSASDVGTSAAVAGKAHLIIFSKIKNEPVIINLKKNMSLGRTTPIDTTKPDIALDSPILSRNHGSFFFEGGSVFYRDEGSLNGTHINGKLYKKKGGSAPVPVRLCDGDVLRIDMEDPSRSHEAAVTIVFATSYDKRSKWRRAKFDRTSLTIGTGKSGMVEFDKSEIVRQNATVSRAGEGCTLSNSSSGIGVKYNNQAVHSSCTVHNKEVFAINNSYFYVEKGEILYNVCLATEPGLSVRLQETFVPDKFSHKVLLRDINLDIDKGDFALIIGGSGAGKSTFMNSILGKYDIKGNISIGGRTSKGGGDLTSDIAYVPQTLPIRKEERLIDVVTDTCILRCKRKMNAKQREAFIMETLDSVGLKAKANMEIKKLSGGEQRRAAIANEVVTDSDVFFLDEPDSGLDPKSGMELMNNLKALSDVGKMVMLISHNYASYPSPEKIYTKIIILAKSNKDSIGRLAFCGSVPEALEFFGVSALKDITKLINPISENGEGRADEFVEKFRVMSSYG